MKGRDTKEIKFYCSSKEKSIIEELAKMNNMSLSEFVRLKALSREKIEYKIVEKEETKFQKNILSELTRIGNNVNQIAKRINFFISATEKKTTKNLEALLLGHKELIEAIDEDMAEIRKKVVDRYDENDKR